MSKRKDSKKRKKRKDYQVERKINKRERKQ